MIKCLLLAFVPVVLFLLVSTTILSLSLVDIKYTFEPVLTGTSLDYLVDETYSIVWLFYGSSNIAFVVIYIVSLMVFKRVSKKY